MLSAFLVVSSVFAVSAIEYQRNQYYVANCHDNSNAFHENDCRILKKDEAVSGSYEAYGMYNDNVESEGWGKLWVHGSESNQGWYESGFLEGALTSLRIFQHFESWYAYQFGSSPPTEATMKFLEEQLDYSYRLVQLHPHDSYYKRLGDVLAQFRGILDGVNFAAPEGKKMSEMDLLLLEASGDLYDIIPATNPSEFKLKIGVLSKQQYHDAWHDTVSCSALIKMTSDASDVFAGHTTWTSYMNMLRIYKNYDLGNVDFHGQSDGIELSSPLRLPYQSSHSSKPGVIYSKDDFYILPNEKQRLVVIETTNGVMNQELYELVTPQSLLTWQRIPMSNSLTTNGADWTATFSKHNSGTYANQWMVVDMKLFTPNVGPSTSDFLWIVEVAPGIAAASDVTPVFVKNGNYWPSYNCPYTESVYIATGFQEAYETYGDAYSYTNCSRAQMFARDEGSIVTYEDFQHELRFNEYQTDPYSQGDPSNSISSRKDLRTESEGVGSPASSGGVDSKVTSYTRLMNGVSHAECGPTHDTQPVFQWSGSPWENQTHYGQPDVFDFGFIAMRYYDN